MPPGSPANLNLSNNNYTGNSEKAWCLPADPDHLPVIEVAFLNGQDAGHVGRQASWTSRCGDSMTLA